MKNVLDESPTNYRRKSVPGKLLPSPIISEKSFFTTRTRMDPLQVNISKENEFEDQQEELRENKQFQESLINDIMRMTDESFV